MKSPYDTTATAKDRAQWAIAYMQRHGMARPVHGFSRTFCTCLEMGDGDDVIAVIKARIAAGQIDEMLVRRYITLS